MKPFKFLSNPYKEHLELQVFYDEGWQEAIRDIEAGMHYDWTYRCPHSIGTMEYEMWVNGYRDRYHIQQYRTPRL